MVQFWRVLRNFFRGTCKVWVVSSFLANIAGSSPASSHEVTYGNPHEYWGKMMPEKPLLPNALEIQGEMESCHAELDASPEGFEVQIDALSFDGRSIKKVATATVNKAGPRRGGKSLEMDRLAQDLLKNNPAAKLARVSFVDGQEVIHTTEAAGELTKHPDGVYRPLSTWPEHDKS